MTQSNRMSFVEAITNVVVGYSLAVATQIVVFPWFGLQASLGETLRWAGFSPAYRSCAVTRCAGCSKPRKDDSVRQLCGTFRTFAARANWADPSGGSAQQPEFANSS